MSRFFTNKKSLSRKWGIASIAMLSATALMPQHAIAGSEPQVGDIMMFAANFCPRGYASAEGQLLAISQNDALFSLYGTQYGGDGRTTFGLPDLRNRTPISAGQGPGLTPRNIGQKLGQNSIFIDQAQLPTHSHSAVTQSSLYASTADGNTPSPTGNVLADDGGDDIYKNEVQANATMSSEAAVSNTTVNANEGGQGIPIDAVQPFIGIRYCIALVGIYPSRN